jgi:hypothetical protein
MYQLRLGDTVTQHRSLQSVTTAVLVNLFEHRPDITRAMLESMTPEERHEIGKLTGEILHDGHKLLGCADCLQDLRQTYEPFGKDQ